MRSLNSLNESLFCSSGLDLPEILPRYLALTESFLNERGCWFMSTLPVRQLLGAVLGESQGYGRLSMKFCGDRCPFPVGPLSLATRTLPLPEPSGFENASSLSPLGSTSDEYVFAMACCS